MRRVMDLAQSIIESIHDLPALPAIAVFEDYGPIGRTSGKITQRAEICGILKWQLTSVFCVPVIAVSPKGLKKYATGNGNAAKEAVMNAAHNKGFTAETTDEADAFFAACAGADILAGRNINIEYTRLNPL